MKPMDMQKLTQRKVTVPIVMLLGVLVLGWKADNITVSYLSEFFLKKAVAEEQYNKISDQVRANATLITGHIRTYELNENAKETQRVEDQLYDLELYVAANGQNELAINRKRDLKANLSKLFRVRNCIVRNLPNEECGNII